jgi:hypothetical protein
LPGQVKKGKEQRNNKLSEQRLTEARCVTEATCAIDKSNICVIEPTWHDDARRLRGCAVANAVGRVHSKRICNGVVVVVVFVVVIFEVEVEVVVVVVDGQS